MFSISFLLFVIGCLYVYLSLEEQKQSKNINIDKDGFISKKESNKDKEFNEKINLIKHTKFFDKLAKKQIKLKELIHKNESNALISNKINELFENSINNILVLVKVENILNSLKFNKLNKKNKELYKTNELFYENEKSKFKESLELYDYIILKLIDIDLQKNYDYSEIQVYIDSVINSNKNLDLDYLHDKYIIKNQEFEKTLQFGLNNEKNNLKNKGNIYI